MPRFFIRQNQINENKLILVGEDAHHVARSLRMAVGDKITACDMQGNEYDCKITDFEDDSRVFCDILGSKHSDTEPPLKITLFQALSKGDKLDTVIQKSVECGVAKIVPFESERCVVRCKADAEDRKTERRRRIAAEAAKQCGRGILPEVTPTVDFDSMLDMAFESELVLFCYEGDGTEPLGKILSGALSRKTDGSYPSVALVVGSEGGFSIDEAKRAKDNGAYMAGLGKRILRTETAPIFALSCLIYATELS